MSNYDKSPVLDYGHRGRLYGSIFSPGNVDDAAWRALIASAAGPGDHAAVEIGVIPLARLGPAEKLAEAVVYLASDEADNVSGQEFFVDGGLHAGHVGAAR